MKNRQLLVLSSVVRDLTKLQRRRQQERQKSNMFNEKNNNSVRFFFHTFLYTTDFAVPA